jgi:hypothetical protein
MARPSITISLNSGQARAIMARIRILAGRHLLAKGTHGIGSRLQRSPFSPEAAWRQCWQWAAA